MKDTKINRFLMVTMYWVGWFMIFELLGNIEPFQDWYPLVLIPLIFRLVLGTSNWIDSAGEK